LINYIEKISAQLDEERENKDKGDEVKEKR
jgi:hypothetical protein